MPVGPGKYDELCTHVRQQTGALGAIVIVIQGEKGSGFSCQAIPGVMLGIPALLRMMAAEIESSGPPSGMPPSDVSQN